MNRLLLWIFSPIFLFLFLFMAYFLGAFVSPIFWFFGPFIALSILSKGRMKESRLPRWLITILFVILIPLFFQVLLVPFRLFSHVVGAIIVRFGGAADHELLAYWTQLFGLSPQVPRILDLVQGIFGVAAGFVGGLYDGYWRHRLMREVSDLPTSKVSSVALGLVELKGIARREVTDPESRSPLLSFSGTELKASPFYLEDSTGKILVDAAGAKVRSRNVYHFGGRFHEIILTRRVKELNRWGTPGAGELLDGDAVYVLGTVEKNSIPDPDVPYTIRALPLEKDQSNPRNLFLLTDSAEIRLKKEVYKGIKAVIATAVIWIVLSMALCLWNY